LNKLYSNCRTFVIDLTHSLFTTDRVFSYNRENGMDNSHA
jgi:hypothetical protein